jgi:hypothetical protein
VRLLKNCLRFSARTITPIAILWLAVTDAQAADIPCDGKSDIGPALNDALNHLAVVTLPEGLCLLHGSLMIPPHHEIRGAARTASGDGGWAQFGTQITGIGSGSALIATQTGAANSGIEISNLTISTTATAHYDWVISFSNLSNSTMENVLIQNNQQGASGAVRLSNENPRSAISATIPPAWSNSFLHVVFGTKSGMPLLDEVTDSRFTDVYLSGGTGSVEAGANNTFTEFMIDNASDIAMTVRHKVDGPSYANFGIGNFQNCGNVCLQIDGNEEGAIMPSASVITGVNFNNTNSKRTDLLIKGVSKISLGNLIFASSSRINASFANVRQVSWTGGYTSGAVMGRRSIQMIGVVGP